MQRGHYSNIMFKKNTIEILEGLIGSQKPNQKCESYFHMK